MVTCLTGSLIVNSLRRGIEVELEHTDDRSLAKQIAKAHLFESPNYYKYLEDMEKRIEAERKLGVVV